MHWRESQVGGLALVHLSGEIDLQSSPDLHEMLQVRLAQKLPVLILEFTEVAYMDSSGMATLVDYVKQARAFHGKLAVTGLGETLNALFELTRLDEIIPRYATPQDACAALH